MIELLPNECRVLGVLVEKAHTTPGSYPLTLNGLVTGCNQKSNRNPVLSLDEDAVLDAIDGLRKKGLLREAMMSGSRVAKYRHVAREGLSVETSELVVLTELLIRGPQTVGELRARANRMHALDSTDVVEQILRGLMSRETPLVQKLAPAAGSRAARYAQLICPKLHRLDAPAAAASSSPAPQRAPAVVAPDVEHRLGRLEEEVRQLKATLATLIGN